jgi:hypothetical protein
MRSVQAVMGLMVTWIYDWVFSYYSLVVVKCGYQIVGGGSRLRRPCFHSVLLVLYVKTRLLNSSKAFNSVGCKI